jgi:hypothetical protein
VPIVVAQQANQEEMLKLKVAQQCAYESNNLTFTAAVLDIKRGPVGGLQIVDDEVIAPVFCSPSN